MSGISAEIIQRWADDPDAGFDADSPFTAWWRDIVARSAKASDDEGYRECVRAVDDSLIQTVRATQSNIRHAPRALICLMRAIELFRGVDIVAVPSKGGLLDLGDLEQAIFLIAYQFDGVMGDRAWVVAMDAFFAHAEKMTNELIDATRCHSAEGIGSFYDSEDPLMYLDQLYMVIRMLEWFVADDVHRDIGVDLVDYRQRFAELERGIEAGFSVLQASGIDLEYQDAPSWEPWWRHRKI